MARPQWLPTRPDGPGILLAAGLGAISVGLVRVLPKSPLVSDVLIALVLGVLVLNTPLSRIVGIAEVGKEREPDRWASGLRFTAKWVLRLAIIMMGFKAQTSFFGKTELAIIFGVAAASVPSAFFASHVLGALLRVRRPLVDLIAGGTMICGASAVNAVAPVVGAKREEQGVAIGVTFLFSLTAMLSFRAVALALGLEPGLAGLWSGLAVNDLSSAIAVGTQMGEAGGVMAAAAKSARILLLAPVLVTLALARRSARGHNHGKAGRSSLTKSIIDALPMFIVGYIALAVVRGVGDRLYGDAGAWKELIAADKVVVDVLMSAVAAGIGLHLPVRSIVSQSARALAVGAGASLWMAALTVAMITLTARDQSIVAAIVGASALGASVIVYRLFANSAARLRALERRFESGELVTLEEATALLEAFEQRRTLDDALLRKLLDRLSPSIGELIPARTSPLGHGEGCRWITYWEGKTGWALVAVVREPGAATPIHAHPHRMFGKAIEGQLEELRFCDVEPGKIKLVSREILPHEKLVEADGLETLHVVRAVGLTPSIDIQVRGPEIGKPGRRLRPKDAIDPLSLNVGDLVLATEEIDDRPGQAGEGAAAGRLVTPA